MSSYFVKEVLGLSFGLVMLILGFGLGWASGTKYGKKIGKKIGYDKRLDEEKGYFHD